MTIPKPPLYPHYLPTRPEGFTRTIDVPLFDADERGRHADPTFPNLSEGKWEDLTRRIGTEITGVQLSKLTPDGLDEVALLAAQRGVLVFRDQDWADIGPDRQREIVRYFGPLHLHPTMGYPAGTGPEFHVVYADEKVGSLRDLLGSHTSYDLWHVDQTFTPNTPGPTFFWVLESPETGGGDTAFTNLASAYAALSPAYRETLETLELNHTSASVGEIARIGTERALAEAPVLFINPTIASSVVGFKPEESRNVLDFLHNHIKSLDFSCRVKWAPGTVVVWDQRTAAHSAVPDFDDGTRRHMVRMIPYGARPLAFGQALQEKRERVE